MARKFNMSRSLKYAMLISTIAFALRPHSSIIYQGDKCFNLYTNHCLSTRSDCSQRSCLQLIKPLDLRGGQNDDDNTFITSKKEFYKIVEDLEKKYIDNRVSGSRVFII
jgi:hypothetical protein